MPHLLRSLDTAIEREGGRVDVLMLSGGEPTVHPEVLEIIEAATERKVTRVILNTNGIRIAKDDRFVSALGALRGRVEVYLQFDGFELGSHLFHRGEDLRDVKTDALRRLAVERVFTTLAVAVADGVNDHEVGAIADYALATDYIAGVAFQPVFGSGRANPIDPMQRVDHDGHAQSTRRADRRTGSDRTTSSRCPARTPTARRSPTSSRATTASGAPCRRCSGRIGSRSIWGSSRNRIAPDDAMWTALVGMMSETTLVSRPELVDHLLRVCDACDLGVTRFPQDASVAGCSTGRRRWKRSPCG